MRGALSESWTMEGTVAIPLLGEVAAGERHPGVRDAGAGEDGSGAVGPADDEVAGIRDTVSRASAHLDAGDTHAAARAFIDFYTRRIAMVLKDYEVRAAQARADDDGRARTP